MGGGSAARQDPLRNGRRGSGDGGGGHAAGRAQDADQNQVHRPGRRGGVREYEGAKSSRSRFGGDQKSVEGNRRPVLPSAFSDGDGAARRFEESPRNAEGQGADADHP